MYSLYMSVQKNQKNKKDGKQKEQESQDDDYGKKGELAILRLNSIKLYMSDFRNINEKCKQEIKQKPDKR